MRLNNASGHMSKFLTHTWHVVKGCKFDCVYCWAREVAPRYGGDMMPRLVEKQLEGLLRRQNCVIGVSWDGDMWGPWVPRSWILRVLKKIEVHQENMFVTLTKNPSRYLEFIGQLPANLILGGTLESTRYYPEITKAPAPAERFEALCEIRDLDFEVFIVVEPILQFDLQAFPRWIFTLDPIAVEIGAVTGGYHLPEPAPQEIHELIQECRKVTQVLLKPNLKRLYNPARLLSNLEVFLEKG